MVPLIEICKTEGIILFLRVREYPLHAYLIGQRYDYIKKAGIYMSGIGDEVRDGDKNLEVIV